MKKMRIYFALLAIAFGAVIFNSCKKEYAEPTISWTGSVSRIISFDDDSNWNLDLNITFTAEAGIDEIQIWKNIHQGLDVTEVRLADPTGYAGLTTFDYNFIMNHTLSDFTGGVTKIVYEFIVKDKQGQTASKTYTFFVIEAFNVTFVVKDGFNNNITDAVITLGTKTNDAGVYLFEYIEPEQEYNYEVVRNGYETVSGTLTMPNNDTTINVVMTTKLASSWSADIVLALSTQVSWATYNGTLVGQYQSNDIGMAYTYTNAGIGRITTTSNCSGFVEVNIANVTSYDNLVNAYNNGTPVTQYDLNVDEIRAYQVKYFAVKFTDNTYKLVWYKFGHRSPTTGNILGFAYKGKA